MCAHPPRGPGEQEEEDGSAGDQVSSHGGRSVDLVLRAPADPGSVHALHPARRWRKYVYGGVPTGHGSPESSVVVSGGGPCGGLPRTVWSSSAEVGDVPLPPRWPYVG